MGFIIAKLETLRDGSVQIERVRPVGFIGRRGFFARNLDLLTASDDGMWNITREALLRAIEPDAVPGTTLLFDLTPELEKLNVYELVDITGHTSTESTDAILHFKIVCSSLRKSSVQREDGTLAVPPWRGTGLDHYEQIRLEGGSSGGTWAIAEPDQALSAVVLRKS
jgi:hypothetical protein